MTLDTLVYMLLNRGKGFSYTGFPENPDFKPVINFEAHQAELRRVIGLDRKDILADYLAHSGALAVKALPSIGENFSLGVADLGDTFPHDAGQLVMDYDKVDKDFLYTGSFFEYTFPMDYSARITRIGNTLKVHRDQSNTFLTFDITSEGYNEKSGVTTLGVRTPEHTSYKIAVEVTPKTDFAFGITYLHPVFPFRAFVEHIERMVNNLDKFLEQSGLYVYYRTTNSYSEKMAIIMFITALSQLYANH